MSWRHFILLIVVSVWAGVPARDALIGWTILYALWIIRGMAADYWGRGR